MPNKLWWLEVGKDIGMAFVLIAGILGLAYTSFVVVMAICERILQWEQ